MTPHPRANDNVYLKSLSLPPLVVGADAWGRPDKPQPVLVSIKWYNPLPATDSLAGTLNYSTIAKDITSALEARRGGFSSAQSLIEFILYVAVEKGWKGVALGIEVDLPKAILEAGEGLKVGRGYDLQGHGGMDVEMEGGLQAPFGKEELYPRARIGDVRVLCVIGINPHERLAKQTVRVDLEVEEDLAIGSRDGIASHWRGLVKHAVEVVEASSYQTVEALANELATVLLAKWPARWMKISVEKPSALPFVTASGAEVSRFKN